MTEDSKTEVLPETINCYKQFLGENAIQNGFEIFQWLEVLSVEIMKHLKEDLENNNRTATQLTIYFAQEINNEVVQSCQTISMPVYNTKLITCNTYKILKDHCLNSKGNCNITFLGLCAKGFKSNAHIGECLNEQVCNFSENKNGNIKNDEDHFRNAKSESGVDNVIDNDIDAIQYKNENNFVEKNSLQDKRKMTTPMCEDLHDTSTFSDTDSISNELCSDSFEMDESCYAASTVERDFNTSRHLDIAYSEIDQNDNYEAPSDANGASKITTENSCEGNMLPFLNFKETCKECNMNILSSDMMTHMDYHFSLKIVKQESHLYNKGAKSINSQSFKINNLKTSTNSLKPSRKYPKSAKQKCNNSTLKSFLVCPTGKENTPLFEICSLCDRKVESEKFDIHLDYHFAKKLHMDINPVKSYVVQSPKSGKYNHKIKFHDIKSFFKPI